MPGWKHAFSLTRDEVKAATPPGTVRLIEPTAASEDGRHVDRISKYPLPTVDPADPLNWAPWRKVACMFSVSLYAFSSNFVAACIAPALPAWNIAFPDKPRELLQLMQFVAYNVLLLGLGNVFLVPVANIFGRRIVILISTLTLFISSACGASTSNFYGVLVIRMLQGIGSSASETVIPAIVGEMFFVHERGAWMAFYTGSLASGSVVGGISGGYIALRLGWFPLFWVCAILTGLTFMCSVLFVPETIYERGAHCLPIQRNLPRPSRYMPRTPVPYLSLVTLPSMRLTLPSRFRWTGVLERDLTWYQPSSSGDLASTAVAPARVSKQPRSSPATIPTTVPTTTTTTTTTTTYSRPPYTFSDSLKFGMYRGRIKYQFMKPWYTLRLPAVWVASCQYGGLVGAAAVISTVGPEILILPPYNWGETTGLLFIGALVGIVAGALCTGLLADRRLKEFARTQDHGYAEPETRLPIMLPALAIGTGGLLVFGFCAQNPGEYQWVGLEFAYGMVAFALAQVPSLWFSYLIDAYNQLASDCFVMICILRGIVPFIWVIFVTQWVQRDGYLIPFGGFTVIMGVFSLAIVPLLWAGKRMRIATARYVVGNQ
ncbi:major facilitator superfamily domain-containing protein [Podospora australis]|uniref:Major facilitator superfamily domain-containing protein n=1 Tax=Podospora australis TaxID=1536484 RepID=A0AAN6WZL8_9PEZI|nr:major facilitator superfamily domain-containing protein [Podospora australis]